MYDVLGKELWARKGKQGVTSVLDLSRRACLQRYEKEKFNPKGHQKLIVDSYHRMGRPLIKTEFQEEILAGLWDWRDMVARDTDEAASFIASNSELLRIAIGSPLSVEALTTSVGPISQSVLSRAAEIVSIISSVTARGDKEYEIGSKCVGDGNALGKGNENNSTWSAELLSTPIRRDYHSNTTNRTSAVSPFAPDFAFNVPDDIRSGTDRDDVNSGSGPPETSSSSRSHLRSPVLAAEEIFQLAGWNTPSPADARMGLMESPLTIDLNTLSSSSKQQQLSDRLKFSSSSAFSAPTRSPDKDPDKGPGNQIISSANLPKSLSEIYEISNRNRKRNKERKKAK